jgi:hypothetical protein
MDFDYKKYIENNPILNNVLNNNRIIIKTPEERQAYNLFIINIKEHYKIR